MGVALVQTVGNGRGHEACTHFSARPESSLGTCCVSLLLPAGEKVGQGGSGGAIRNHRSPLTPPSPLRGEGVKRSAHLTLLHIKDQHFATAISSGNLSTHSWPFGMMMKVWPRKIPNRPSAVIGLGSAMIT